nr:cation-translocating P-type ATPase [Lachnospiraceae bacterium]
MSRWLENETKLTSIFAGISAASLILSITGVLKNILPVDIAWIAIILCGVPILVGAVRGVILEHDIKADVLVAMALVASVVTGEFFAAGEVALIMQIGSLLEDYTSGKAREGIEKLIRLTPQKAHLFKDEEEKEIAAEDVKVGDIIRVLAGETIPVDGIITEGETTIDQSVMTGESIPVDKRVGDLVSSGTINQFGTFVMKAEKESGNSALQRMVRLAQGAEENKAPIVTLADKWATWLVVVAFACAVGTRIFTGEFMRAVTVLVVFCPCAFILAAPTAVLAGIGNAAKYGMIIRSGDALERLSKIKRIAFDKTGTLTYGKPHVTEVVSLDDQYGKDEILRIAASAEKLSEHPLGRAIVADYEGELYEAADFKVIAGRGISAKVQGKNVLAGKADFMQSEGVDIQASDKQAEKCFNDGATVIYVALDGMLKGFVALADTVREDSADTIRKLINYGINPMLLTGDNKHSAGTIAGKVGIK